MVERKRGKNWISRHLRTQTLLARLLNPLLQPAVYAVLYHCQMFYDSGGRPAPGGGHLFPQGWRHFLKGDAKCVALRIEVIKQFLGTWMNRPVPSRGANSMIWCHGPCYALRLLLTEFYRARTIITGPLSRFRASLPSLYECNPQKGGGDSIALTRTFPSSLGVL